VPWVDFAPVLAAMANQTNIALEFFELSPASETFKDGKIVAGSAAYTPILLNPALYCGVPKIPRAYLERVPTGDRERDRLLVWTLPTAGEEPQLRTIKQAGHQRAHRCRDVARAKRYVAEAELDYGRQGGLSGVVFRLLDNDET
jgi:hypothetical protein